MMELKPIELQQRKEKGIRWQHEPGGSVAAKEDKLPWQVVDEWEGATPHPVIIPRRFLPEHPPEYHKVSLGVEAGAWEVRSHSSNRWQEFGSPESKKEDEEMGARRQENGGVDPSAKFHPLYPLLARVTIMCGAWCLKPRASRLGADRRAQGPPTSWHGRTNW
jgi:hypothetical protein